MSGARNGTEIRFLDMVLDQVASGGHQRLALYMSSTGTLMHQPNQDGSLPAGLTELIGNGYSSPVVNDSDVSSISEWDVGLPGNPAVKTLPRAGAKSFGTFTSDPLTGAEKVTAMAIIGRVTRPSISLTTTNAQSYVDIGGGAFVTNEDLGRAVGSSAIGGTPAGGIAIPTGAVIGELVSPNSSGQATRFVMYKNNVPVVAANGTNGNAGTASVTLGERILFSTPIFDPTQVYTSPPNVTTVLNENVVTFASAITNPSSIVGAVIAVGNGTTTGLPTGTVITNISADGLKATVSANALSGIGPTAPTITGAYVVKDYVVNDNPVIDTTNKLTVKLGQPTDPF